MSLFTPGNILYIEDFEFENGTVPRDKIMIVLYQNDKEAFIIQSLTTSKDKIRENIGIVINHGCYNDTGRHIHFYFYDKNIPVGNYVDTGKQFNFGLDTYVHVKNVSKISTIDLLKYKDKMKIMAKLFDYELKSILTCISNSIYVTKEVKQNITEYLSELNK